jgi:hypothetical protein
MISATRLAIVATPSQQILSVARVAMAAPVAYETLVVDVPSAALAVPASTVGEGTLQVLYECQANEP